MKKILLLLIAFATFSCGSSTPDESNAKEAARAAILHSLKNPDAQFHQNETIEDSGNGTFLYKETINATNSFGGSLAQDVTAKVKWNGGDPSEVQSWSLIDLQFADR